MDWRLSFILSCLLVQMSVAPPVTKDKADEEHKDTDNNVEVMEYHRYLKEVVEALESDPDFLAKLEKAGESDIRTGEIANELEFVNYKVRTRLDELKRNELERLRHLVTKENQLNSMDLKNSKMAQHLDHTNTLSFEIDDLKKLIAKTTEDLAEADRRRRQKFKEYEMQKKFEQEQKMNAMNEEEKKKYAQQLEEMKEKHKKHEPLHHPGSKQQLKEVWETQDHMDEDDFDLQKFFYFHDIDGNGVWDQNEVKALFLKDLDKLYAKDAPEDDLLEREEEMERMREHLFNEADLNKDGVISHEEFLVQSTKVDQDEGWKTLDDQRIFTQEEYEAFQKHMGEKEALIAKGIPPQHQDNTLHNQQFPPQQGGARMPNQQQYNPQQIQIPIQHQVPMHQQVPQQQQQHYNQIPQQQYQGQVMQQGGQFHGQVQLESNQIPVHHQQQQQMHQQQQQMHQQQQQQVHQQQQQMHQQQQQQVHQQQQQVHQQQQQMHQQQQVQQQQQQQQYQNQQQFQHSNVQAQIPQQQQLNAPNQILQQQNTPNQIPQQQASQNQTPQEQNIAGQQNQQPIQNSAQHIQQNSVHSSGKV